MQSTQDGIECMLENIGNEGKRICLKRATTSRVADLRLKTRTGLLLAIQPKDIDAGLRTHHGVAIALYRSTDSSLLLDGFDYKCGGIERGQA